MSIVKELLKYKSISIVGMAKNTGKTTCLNYILNYLYLNNISTGITSIGVDGEERDVLYDTLKPRIVIKNGNYFITSEKHFAQSNIAARVISISNQMSALGRLITAQAEADGQVIISGPSDSVWLHNCINSLGKLGAEKILVDGALSRMSLASPTITDAMILCTGAAYSTKLEQLVKKTKYICDLINLNEIESRFANNINGLSNGIWLINDDDDNCMPQKIDNSIFTIDLLKLNAKINQMKCKNPIIFINGALSNAFLKEICINSNAENIHIIVKDFSKIFAEPATYYKFIRRGGKINVLKKTNLIAVCTNPTSPERYNYEAEELRSILELELKLKVYDVMQEIKKD
jgi:hypothetical protein